MEVLLSRLGTLCLNDLVIEVKVMLTGFLLKYVVLSTSGLPNGVQVMPLGGPLDEFTRSTEKCCVTYTC